jgi:hypothetical protein
MAKFAIVSLDTFEALECEIRTWFALPPLMFELILVSYLNDVYFVLGIGLQELKLFAHP